MAVYPYCIINSRKLTMVEPSNALQESISRKGQHSYYYAHAPRDLDEIEQAIVISGDNIVTGGPPKLVETTEIT